MQHESIVIVGAGQCGGQAADALLRGGHREQARSLVASLEATAPDHTPF